MLTHQADVYYIDGSQLMRTDTHRSAIRTYAYFAFSKSGFPMHINLTNNQPLFLWSQNYTQFIQGGLEREQLRAGPFPSCPFASVSKRFFLRNHSYENELHLHIHFHANQTAV